MRRIVDRYDMLIYRLAYRLLERMCKRNPGFAYLFQLWLAEWRKQHPITPELERATDLFFCALKEHKQ